MKKIFILLFSIAFILKAFAQPPAVSSFLPESGPVGTIVTISGTNFNATSANNTVYFGATRATVTGGNTTSLTVTAPAGATYKPISVLDNATGLTGYSSRPFIITFINSMGTGVPDYFDINSYPNFVAIGDLDGDGKSDLAIAYNGFGSSTISVMRNTSTSGSIDASSFSSHVGFATGSGPASVGIGDVDGDGKPDLVAVNQFSNTLSILRNTSTSGSIDASSFAIKVDFATGTNPRSVTVGDVDSDGKPDLVAANFNSGTLSVFRNTSTSGSIDAASFATKVDFGTGSNPSSVAIGDVDGDGKPDLATANFGSGNVSVLRNASTSGIDVSSFEAKVDFSTGANPNSIAFGNVNGDGKPDLAIVNNGSNNISVLRNNSNSGSITIASFADKINLGALYRPFSIAIGDLDGDDISELLSTKRNLSGQLVIIGAPVFTVCPLGQNLGCNPGPLPGPGTVTATDNCGSAPTVTSANGAITSDGCNRSQTRTYTATDGCGNSSTCTQTFTWTEDVTPPEFTFCPAGQDLGCNPGGLPPPDNATATDNCSTPTITSADGAITSDGINSSQTRTYTATDGCGNMATCMQTFTWTETATYYEDSDVDGYGKSGVTVQACVQPAGYAPQGGDCNDGNAAVNPAATEICGNSIDENCDGQIGEGCPNLPVLQINDVTVYESEGVAILTVSLSKKSTQAVTVDYNPKDGTAKKKNDYERTQGTLTIPAGSQTGTISIIIVNDNIAEPTEFFDVKLVNPVNATIGDGTGRVTIQDGAAPIARSNVTTAISDKAKNPVQEQVIQQKLTAHAVPNPSGNYFTLQSRSANPQPLTVRVLDNLGRVVEVRSGIAANSTFTLGHRYRPGMYYVEVLQGRKKISLKLIKQPD